MRAGSAEASGKLDLRDTLRVSVTLRGLRAVLDVLAQVDTWALFNLTVAGALRSGAGPLSAVPRLEVLLAQLALADGRKGGRVGATLRVECAAPGCSPFRG